MFQLVTAVLPQGFEHAVPVVIADAQRHEHRRVHETGDDVDNVELVDAFPTGDGLGTTQVEAVGEHGETTERRLLVFTEQVVTPRDDRFERTTAARAEKPEAIVEAVSNLMQ